jgi:hypothetical protein
MPAEIDDAWPEGKLCRALWAHHDVSHGGGGVTMLVTGGGVMMLVTGGVTMLVTGGGGCHDVSYGEGVRLCSFRDGCACGFI